MKKDVFSWRSNWKCFPLTFDLTGEWWLFVWTPRNRPIRNSLILGWDEEPRPLLFQVCDWPTEIGEIDGRSRSTGQRTLSWSQTKKLVPMTPCSSKGEEPSASFFCTEISLKSHLCRKVAALEKSCGLKQFKRFIIWKVYTHTGTTLKYQEKVIFF